MAQPLRQRQLVSLRQGARRQCLCSTQGVASCPICAACFAASGRQTQLQLPLMLKSVKKHYLQSQKRLAATHQLACHQAYCRLA